MSDRFFPFCFPHFELLEPVSCSLARISLAKLTACSTWAVKSPQAAINTRFASKVGINFKYSKNTACRDNSVKAQFAKVLQHAWPPAGRSKCLPKHSMPALHLTCPSSPERALALPGPTGHIECSLDSGEERRLRLLASWCSFKQKCVWPVRGR